MTQHNGDILRITPVFTITPYLDRMVNVWHVRLVLDTDKTDAAMAAFVGDWLELIYGGVKTYMSTALNFEEFDWANVTQDLVYLAELWPTWTNGDASGDLLAPNLAGYLFGRTPFSKVYGRKYVPGFTELQNTDVGQPSTAVLLALAGLGVSGYGLYPVSAGVSFQGVVSTLNHGYVIPPVVVAKAQWRALRRRVPGVGG